MRVLNSRLNLCGAAIGLALSACAQAPVPPPQVAGAAPDPRQASLTCDGGLVVSVTFLGDGATLEADGRTVRLSQQLAASGIHYAGDGHDLRGKGPDLTWTEPTGAVHRCRDQELAQAQAEASR